MKKGLLSTSLLLFILMPLTAGSDVLRDPTRPDYLKPDKKTTKMAKPVAKSKKKGRFSKGLKLEQTIISSSRRLAVINGKTYRLGSRLKGAKLIEIHSDRVVFRKSGRNHPLYLFKPVNIKEVAGN